MFEVLPMVARAKKSTLAPVAGHDAMRSPGRPLDAATRALMAARIAGAGPIAPVPSSGDSQLRLGLAAERSELEAERMAGRALRSAKIAEPAHHLDFSHVRVHTDQVAARSARALGALAYTAGNHVVFDEDQYAPSTVAGRRLLAHELVHVLQQRSGITGVVQRQTPGTPSQTKSTMDEERFVAEAIDHLHAGAELYRSGPSSTVTIDRQRLRRQLLGWRDVLAKSRTLIQSGLDATLARNLDAAYADAVRAVVSLAAQQLDSTAHDLYQEYRELIDEIAWPKATLETSRSELIEALPEAERRRIKIVTEILKMPDVLEYFDRTGATVSVPLPDGVTARFSSSVAVALRPGLQSVAASLIDASALSLNATTTLALNLERFGGDFAAYRFTFVEHKAPSGRRSKEVLVERLGSLGVEGLTPSQTKAGQEKFDRHGFKRASGWSERDFALVLAAVDRLPDAILSPIDGIVFERGQVHPTDPEVGGHYDSEAHAITIFNRAFEESLTRHGPAGSSFAAEGVRDVAHEIAHAIDLLPLRKAWTQYEQTGGSPAAKRGLEAARSASGRRYKVGASGKYEMVEDGSGAGQSEFRIAAAKDGRIRVTKYADKEWQEYFAESFSLYMTTPELLKALRPSVFRYFLKHYPTQSVPVGPR